MFMMPSFALERSDISALSLSFGVAAAASLVVGAAGTPLAWFVAKRSGRAVTLIMALSSLPLVLPPTVTGYLLLEIVGRQAPVGRILERHFGLVLVYHWSGAVLAAAVCSFPLFVLTARSAFAGVDSNYEQAARLLGCREFDVFRRVTVPLALPGLSVALLLCFVRALGDFGTTLMIAGNVPGRTQTAALALYDAALLGESARARSLASVLGAVALVALLVAGRHGRSRKSGRTS